MSAKREQEKDEFLGTRVREYEILELVGKGGMGAVYRARHLYLDEERAIKVVHSRFAEDQKFVDRFIREAKMLVRLRHPNLVQFFEFGTLAENTFFMVLEFIRGESVLTRIQRDKRISIVDSIRIVREAALGLHAAHQKGIVHRDISPDNLLIVKNDEGEEVTKVIDFGIAKPLLDQNRIFTRTNAFLGKPQFCSPEQCGILEDGEVIDHRSDIYSLGITMYYMLAGRLPFRAASPQAYLVKHIQEEPPPISSYFPPGEFPEELEAIIKKTLAKKRENRFSSMEDFAKSLKDYAASLISSKASEEIPFYDLPAGYQFERRYLIESKIRQRSRAVIYKALDEILQVPVALKIIDRNILREGNNLERLKRGIILSRKVTHPHVCRVYDVNETKEFVYISMEYIEGQTLTHIVRTEKRLRFDDAVRYTKQMLLGVREAHRAGVIHRNLKPANLMIQPDGQLRIMDFATSISSLPGAIRLTADGEYHGTPTYMAPEQFRDGKMDERSDLYAVAVILFEMITGRLPFKAVTVPALILAHTQSKPSSVSQLVPEVPPLLEQIISKGLQAEPERRFVSADDFLQALLQYERFQTIEESKLSDEASRKKQFEEYFEKGKALYEQSRIEEAIAAWREALSFSPGNQIAQKCITAAENRLNSERKTRNEMSAEVEEVRKLIDSGSLSEAKKLLDKLEKRLPLGPRFDDLRNSLLDARGSIETGTTLGQKLADAIGQDAPDDVLGALPNSSEQRPSEGDSPSKELRRRSRPTRR